MATYAVGDIQGCFDELQGLLALVQFNPQHDTLWCAGDLINRGPTSLEVLKFLQSLGNSAVCVLGNHDLHALAVHYGVREGYADDTLDAILASPKRDGLMNWLRHRPLMHHEHGFTMAHAGIYPEWSVEQALGYAAEVEAVVQNDDTVTQYLETMYGNEPDCFTEALTGFDRLRVITNAFTRMRFVTADGHLDMKVNTKTIHPDPQFTPWFTVPKRAITTPVLFGHWAALEGDIHQTEYKVVALDTGCVWGNALTAFRLDDQKLFSYRCK